MANKCDFSITVRGPLEDRVRFASAFRSTIRELDDDDPGERRRYALLDDGTWGQDGEDDHKWLELWAIGSWRLNPAERSQCSDLDDTVLELADRSEFRGSCKWMPPVAWMKKVSSLIPSLSFFCRSITEYCAYEEYTVSSAEVRRLKLAVFDWKTDEWIPHDPDEDV
jgi:hypothetical protein